MQVCKTCAELTSFPVVLPCKHHFCWDCLVDVSPTLSSCPVCERAMIMLPEGACVEKVDGLHLPFEVEADKALLEMGSIPNSPPVSSSFPALMSARNSCFPALVPKGALSCAKGCIGALCQSPPSPEKSSSARLLLIGVDGCRPDCLRKVPTPHIDELIREGAYSLKVAGDETGRTLPGWYSVLSGTCSKKHRIMDDDVPDDGPTDAMQRYPIFTSRLQAVRPKVKSQFFTTLEGMHGLLDLHGIPCIQSDDDDKQAERLEKTLRKVATSAQDLSHVCPGPGPRLVRTLCLAGGLPRDPGGDLRRGRCDGAPLRLLAVLRGLPRRHPQVRRAGVCAKGRIVHISRCCACRCPMLLLMRIGTRNASISEFLAMIYFLD